MVADSFNMLALYYRLTNLCSLDISGSHFPLSIGVTMSIKNKIERVKEISLNLMTSVLSIIAYLFGVSLSFFLWKLSTVFRSGVKKSYWSDPEEKEDYKSQY